MCFVRHLPVESAVESVESIMEYVKTGQVSGLGCDSTELGNPVSLLCRCLHFDSSLCLLSSFFDIH